MASGGAGRGQGRKPIAEEYGTRDLARKAIIAKHGTLEKGLQSLLEAKEPILTRFVFEHAFGKPTDKVDVTSGGEAIVVTFRDAE